MSITNEPIPGANPGNTPERSIQTFRSPDPELNAVASESLQTVSIEKLDQLMRAHQKFNEPVYVVDNQGREKRDNNFKLKRFLREIPAYFDSAQEAGLSADQAQQLTVTLLNSSPYEFHDPEITVSLMGRAFRNAAKADHPLSAEDYDKLNTLVAESAKCGVDHNALYAYSLAQRIGLSTTQSTEMISKLVEADGSISGYTFGPFCDALKTLNVAQVDPEMVVQVFDKLGGDRPYFHQAIFKAFEDIITFGCPSHGMSPQEVIDTILRQVEAGEDIEEVIVRFQGSEQKQLPGEKQIEVINPKEERDRYFVQKPGELELAALPYQTQRPLNEGLRDLENIAVASSGRWQETGEGFWVHDRESGTWYSLGGQIEMRAMAMRHNMMPYDISQLSAEPLMFHCHPQDFEVMIRPPRGATIFPEQYTDQVTKFLAATPSRADYAVIADLVERATDQMTAHSYIVHSLGVTEFTYPTDLEQLKQMSADSRELRDQALLDFDWQALRGREIDPEVLTEQLATLLNKRLPEGFKIKLHPRGYDLNQELNEKH
jgi:hypothetical protein